MKRAIIAVVVTVVVVVVSAALYILYLFMLAGTSEESAYNVIAVNEQGAYYEVITKEGALLLKPIPGLVFQDGVNKAAKVIVPGVHCFETILPPWESQRCIVQILACQKTVWEKK